MLNGYQLNLIMLCCIFYLLFEMSTALGYELGLHADKQHQLYGNRPQIGTYMDISNLAPLTPRPLIVAQYIGLLVTLYVIAKYVLKLTLQRYIKLGCLRIPMEPEPTLIKNVLIQLANRSRK